MRSTTEKEELRDALGLLTLIGGGSPATEDELCEWCVRAPREVRDDLEWASCEELVSVKRGRLALTKNGLLYVMVNWIARHGVATAAQMADRFKTPRGQSTEILDQAALSGMLRVAGALKFEPLLYVATRKGLSFVKRAGLVEALVSVRGEPHLRACGGVAILLEEEYGPEGPHGPHWELLSEREQDGPLKDARLRAPEYYLNGKKETKRPDLVLVRRFRDSDRLQILLKEVELTYKTEEMMDAMLRAYALHETIDGVDYHVAVVVKQKIIDAAERVRARLARELASGGLEPYEVKRIGVFALEDWLVPAMSRAAHYEPEAPSEERKAMAERIAMSRRWRRALRLEVLETTEWVTRNGVVTPDAVAMWRGYDDVGKAEALLAIGHGLGWLEYSDILRAEGGMFFASKQGRHQVGLDTRDYAVHLEGDGHYYRAAVACIHARVSALLSRTFPDREIRSRWELRGDRLFGRDKRPAVGTTKPYCQDYMSPHHLILGHGVARVLPEVVLVIAGAMDATKAREIVTPWLETDAIGHLHLFVSRPQDRVWLTRAVAKLGGVGDVSIEDLPRSPREELRVAGQRQQRRAVSL
jgi:hypothetical protein